MNEKYLICLRKIKRIKQYIRRGESDKAFLREFATKKLKILEKPKVETTVRKIVFELSII